MDVVMVIVVFPLGVRDGMGVRGKKTEMKKINYLPLKIRYKFAICRKETITKNKIRKI